MNLLLTICLATAFANEAAPFTCCHVHPAARAAEPLRVRVYPVNDRRSLGATKGSSLRVGKVRGGYGNPFPLNAADPVAELVTTVLRQHLSGVGHPVGHDTTDLSVRGTLEQFAVDISSHGSFKIDAELVLDVRDEAGNAEQIRLSLHEHERDGQILSVSKTLNETAKAWYGRSGGLHARYVNAAAVELGLIGLADRLTAPHSRGEAIFILNGPVGAASPPPGCGRDTDCKGARICIRGVCESP